MKWLWRVSYLSEIGIPFDFSWGATFERAKIEAMTANKLRIHIILIT